MTGKAVTTARMIYQEVKGKIDRGKDRNITQRNWRRFGGRIFKSYQYPQARYYSKRIDEEILFDYG